MDELENPQPQYDDRDKLPTNPQKIDPAIIEKLAEIVKKDKAERELEEDAN